MSNITYTRKGSKTTRKISEAPLAVQKIWAKASNLGVNVLRVRVAQDRNEIHKTLLFINCDFRYSKVDMDRILFTLKKNR